MALANVGARVVVSDIDLAGAEAAAHEIPQYGGEAIAVYCDVGCDGSFEALRDVVLDQWGRVDIVMNNAGVILSGHPEDIPVSEWQRVLNINLMSVVRSNAVFLSILLGPGPVATNIMSSTKVLTNDVQMRGTGEEFELLTPLQVGEQVVNAIRTNQFFLPTHPAVTARLVKRACDVDENLQNQIDHPSILAVAKLHRNT